MITNLLKPDSGTITINGLDFNRDTLAIKRLFGIQISEEQIIPELTLREYLFFIGKIYQMPTDEIMEQISHLTDYFYEANEDIEKSLSSFSTGMKKKAGICAALIHKPEILIMDEPFANLDPVSSELLCQFLIRYKNENRILIVSSHDLLYVEKVATHIGVLHDNTLVYNGTIHAFKETGTRSMDKELLKLISNTDTKASESHLEHLI